MGTRNNIWQVLCALFLLGFASIGARADEFTNLMAKGYWALQHHDFSTALAYCDEAVNLKTNDSSAYNGRASAYFGMHLYQQAESDYTKSIECSTDVIQLASVYYGRGDFYAQTTNTEKAMDDLSKAIQLNPAWPGPYVSRAAVWEQKGRYQFALYDCNMAIMLDPNVAEPYRLKGNAHEMMQDYKGAIDDYSVALNVNPTNGLFYASRASVHYLQEDYNDAISDFSHAIQLDPTNGEAAYEYSARGLCLSRIGDYKAGILDCQKALGMDTNYWVACNNLAWLLATAPQSKLRDGKTAVGLADHACDLTEWKNAYAIGTLAAAYAETGDFDKAVAWERKCILLGLLEKEMHQARVELDLFEQKKPYHAER